MRSYEDLTSRSRYVSLAILFNRRDFINSSLKKIFTFTTAGCEESSCCFMNALFSNLLIEEGYLFAIFINFFAIFFHPEKRGTERLSPRLLRMIMSQFISKEFQCAHQSTLQRVMEEFTEVYRIG